MEYCHTASYWQGELHTSQGRKELTVAYICLHKLQHEIVFKHRLPILADVLEEILLQESILT